MSATMAALYAKGQLELDTEFVAESIIGTRFSGKLTKTIALDDLTAVEPMVTGQSFLTGIHQFMATPDDPVKFGFRVE